MVSTRSEATPKNRKIIHIDMDAFYAAVEQRDNPSYRGKPVIVGGKPDSRGVVATASYEARKFGVHSAMPSAQAYRLCPQGIFVYPRFEAYREASRTVMSILREYTDLVEPLSLDEAYLDVTENKLNIDFATEIAKEIRRRIFETTQLTASAGVASNKFLAKLASDMRKPNGLMVIPPERIAEILLSLEVRKLPGVGRVTEKRMNELGIFTTEDIRRVGEEYLRAHFGRSGGWYFSIAHGIDDREVAAEHERKSLGSEETYSKDLIDESDIRRELKILARDVSERLLKRSLAGRTVTLKITYSDFTKITRSHTTEEALDSAEAIEEITKRLLSRTEACTRPLRLLGIQISNFGNDEIIPSIPNPPVLAGCIQLSLPFPE